MNRKSAQTFVNKAIASVFQSAGYSLVSKETKWTFTESLNDGFYALIRPEVIVRQSTASILFNCGIQHPKFLQVASACMVNGWYVNSPMIMRGYSKEKRSGVDSLVYVSLTPRTPEAELSSFIKAYLEQVGPWLVENSNWLSAYEESKDLGWGLSREAHPIIARIVGREMECEEWISRNIKKDDLWPEFLSFWQKLKQVEIS